MKHSGTPHHANDTPTPPLFPNCFPVISLARLTPVAS